MLPNNKSGSLTRYKTRTRPMWCQTLARQRLFSDLKFNGIFQFSCILGNNLKKFLARSSFVGMC